MTEPAGVQLSGMPRGPHSLGPEGMVTSTLDKLDVLQERYIQAVQFMDWFEPAWNMLADDEQRILKEFYMTGNQRSGATARLAVELNFSETHIERLRSKALSRLTLILFGK